MELLSSRGLCSHSTYHGWEGRQMRNCWAGADSVESMAAPGRARPRMEELYCPSRAAASAQLPSATTLLPFQESSWIFLCTALARKQLKQKHSRQTRQLQATSDPTSQISRQVSCRKDRIWKDLMGPNFPRPWAVSAIPVYSHPTGMVRTGECCSHRLASLI